MTDILCAVAIYGAVKSGSRTAGQRLKIHHVLVYESSWSKSPENIVKALANAKSVIDDEEPSRKSDLKIIHCGRSGGCGVWG